MSREIESKISSEAAGIFKTEYKLSMLMFVTFTGDRKDS